MSVATPHDIRRDGQLLILVCCAILLLLLARPVMAVTTLSLSLDTSSLLENTSIRAVGLTADLILTPTGLVLSGSAKQLQLPAPYGKVKQLTIDCPTVVWTDKQIQCKRGILRFQHKLLGKQKLSFSLRGNPQTQQYHFSLSKLAVAKGHIETTGDWSPQQWSLKVKTTMLDAPVLFEMSQEIGLEAAVISSWINAGTIRLDGTFTGRKRTLLTANIKESWGGLTGSDVDGKWVAENVAAESQLEWDVTQEHWKVAASLTAGEAYAEPVFFDFSKHAIRIVGEGGWAAKTGNFSVSQAQLTQQDVDQATFSASGNIAAWQDIFLQTPDNRI